MTLARLMTFKSAILERAVKISSWTPSVKKAFAFSSLRFSNGRTAIDFSESAGVAVEVEAVLDVRCRKKKTPAPIRRASRTATTTTSCHGIRFGLTSGEGIDA